MASVRVRKQTGKLYLDFRYRRMRCRELLQLTDTPTNRKRAEALLKRIEAEITLGTFDYSAYFPDSPHWVKASQSASDRQGDKPSFHQFAKVWFDESSPRWRDSYRKTVETILFGRLCNSFGEADICQISRADVLGFRADLANLRSIGGKALSASHINRHMKLLGAICTEAADRFGMDNPCATIKPLKVNKTDVDPFTLAEIQRLLASVREDFRHYYQVRFFTGLRTAEIDGLQWRYVDFERREILIRETLVDGQLCYTKTDGSQREVVMSGPVFQALKAQQSITGNSQFVFCSSAGTPLNHHNVTKRVWYPLLRHLELRKRRPYQTRHTAATLWLASGESPEWIARQMGHATTEMLFRVYSRFVPNLTRQDGSAFERLLAQNIDLEIPA